MANEASMRAPFPVDLIGSVEFGQQQSMQLSPDALLEFPGSRGTCRCARAKRSLFPNALRIIGFAYVSSPRNRDWRNREIADQPQHEPVAIVLNDYKSAFVIAGIDDLPETHPVSYRKALAGH